MLKLLYKPTRNVFTLPDEEALRIKAEDRGNDYEILEAGLQEEKAEKVTKKEADKLVKEKQDKIEANKQEEKAKEEKKAEKAKKNSK